MSRAGRAKKAPVLYSPPVAQPRKTACGASAGGAATDERPKTKREAHEFTTVVSRVKSELGKCRAAQALLDVYCTDGWRGARRAIRLRSAAERLIFNFPPHSREKPKPTAELAAAQRRILEAKVRLRPNTPYFRSPVLLFSFSLFVSACNPPPAARAGRVVRRHAAARLRFRRGWRG